MVFILDTGDEGFSSLILYYDLKQGHYVYKTRFVGGNPLTVSTRSLENLAKNARESQLKGQIPASLTLKSDIPGEESTLEVGAKRYIPVKPEDLKRFEEILTQSP